MEDIISVVIPVYSVEKYIKRCLKSIVNQSYTNLEIIVVDDGSPDLSGKIADEFAKRDNRIHVIHKKNGGLSDARNVGISFCHGKYVTFIDSDDFVSEDYIKYLYDLIKKYNVKISSSFYQMVSGREDVEEDCNSVEYLLTAEEAISKMLYRDNISHNAWGKLFDMSLFKQNTSFDLRNYYSDGKYYSFLPLIDNQYRFPLGLLNEDLALIYYLVMESGKVAAGTKKTYYYYQNLESITQSKVKEKDFTVFDLYQVVSNVILDKYPNLQDPVLEFEGTIYTKLYKRLLLKQPNDFVNEQKMIRKVLQQDSKGILFRKIRIPTKIRLYVGAHSKKLFIILSNIENRMGSRG